MQLLCADQSKHMKTKGIGDLRVEHAKSKSNPKFVVGVSVLRKNYQKLREMPNGCNERDDPVGRILSVTITNAISTWWCRFRDAFDSLIFSTGEDN